MLRRVSRSRRLARLGLGALLIAAACFSVDTFSGDPFPTRADLTTGAVLVQVREGDGEPATASIDVLAPITVVDPCQLDAGPPPGCDGGDCGPCSRPAPVRRSSRSLTMLGEVITDGGPVDAVPRARFSADVLALHPCDEGMLCKVGDETATRDLRYIVGADTLAGDAVRFRFSGGAVDLFVLPDIAGNNSARTSAGDAVFAAPFRGGGTLNIGGAEVPFVGRRIAVGACLDPDPRGSIAPPARGADALLVVSTGLRRTILTESAYERWRTSRNMTAPTTSDLQADAGVWLPSGQVNGGVTTLPSLALVASGGVNARGPCRDLYTQHLFAGATHLDGQHDHDCPCPDRDECGAPAALELTPATGIPILVVPDDDPRLQALRTELRPDQAEVDGILGTAAFDGVELDVDYPSNRLLARCIDGNGTTCFARTAVARANDVQFVNACPGDNPN